MSITFSTCWYNFKAKFDSSVYQRWMHNMLSNVNNYNLVVYTDEAGYNVVQPYLHSKIKIIIKPYEEFYTHQLRDHWISNHENNVLLKDCIDWRVNMLWSEKIHFVSETIKEQYFITDFYGWCDIGYFRGRRNDLDVNALKMWPSPHKITALDKDKIYYGLVNNDNTYVDSIYNIVNNKNANGVPSHPIPRDIGVVAGGFFILHKNNIEWWHTTYYDKLKLYFENKELVKDDQIILADCIFSSIHHFCLCKENTNHFDHWFMFQRILI
jgi:hypothetical protein